MRLFFLFLSVAFIFIGGAILINLSLAIAFSIIFIFGSLFFLWINFRHGSDANLKLLFLITAVVHLLVVLFLEYTQFYPFGGGRDDLFYHETAVQISDRFHRGEFSLSGLDLHQYYPVFLGIIYSIFGQSQLVAKSFGVILAALSAAIIYLICREIGASPKKSFFSGMIVNFYPSYLFYGSLLLKDTLVVPLSLVCLLVAVRLLRQFNLVFFLFFFVNLIALTFLRPYAGITLFLAFIISFIIFSQNEKMKKIILTFFIMVTTCFTPFAMGYSFFGAKILSGLLNPDFITSFREDNYSIGSSSIGIKMDFTSPMAFIVAYLPSFVYVLLGPLPWQIFEWPRLLALAEIIIFYPIIYLALKIFFQPLILKKAAPLLLFSVGLIMAIALFSDNLGANTRLRMAAYMSLACLAPLGLQKNILER